MTPTRKGSFQLSGRGLLVLAVSSALWLGCQDRQVVAVVGKTKLTQTDLQQFANGRQGLAPNAEALEALVDRELMAEGARREKVLNELGVKADLAAAEREVLAHALLERHLSKVTVEAELRKRYEQEKDKLTRRQIHVAQIAVNGGTSAEARKNGQAKIDTLYNRLVGGDDFNSLAKQASEDRISAARGGDLGILREGQVDRTFFAAAAGLKHGEYSKPIQTAFGFHIAKALEDPTVATPAFDEVRGTLAAEARAEAESKLLSQLRSNITVKRYPSHLPAAPSNQAASTGGPLLPP